MLELYFNDGNFLPESREEEQSAETVLNIMLAGKTTDTEMHLALFLPCAHVQGGADQSGRRHNAADRAFLE